MSVTGQYIVESVCVVVTMAGSAYMTDALQLSAAIANLRAS